MSERAGGTQNNHRPFISALVSARGFEADAICELVDEVSVRHTFCPYTFTKTLQMLWQAPDATARNTYRRVMTKLVQNSDKLPGSFYLTLDPTVQCTLVGRGGFSHVYDGFWQSEKVAIKVPDTTTSFTKPIEWKVGIAAFREMRKLHGNFNK